MTMECLDAILPSRAAEAHPTSRPESWARLSLTLGRPINNRPQVANLPYKAA